MIRTKPCAASSPASSCYLDRKTDFRLSTPLLQSGITLIELKDWARSWSFAARLQLTEATTISRGMVTYADMGSRCRTPGRPVLRYTTWPCHADCEIWACNRYATTHRFLRRVFKRSPGQWRRRSIRSHALRVVDSNYFNAVIGSQDRCSVLQSARGSRTPEWGYSRFHYAVQSRSLVRRRYNVCYARGLEHGGGQ